MPLTNNVSSSIHFENVTIFHSYVITNVCDDVDNACEIRHQCGALCVIECHAVIHHHSNIWLYNV